VIFEPGKHLFFDISSTNIDTLVPSLYQCFETRSVEIFFVVVSATSAPPFQPLRHQRNICHQGWTVNRKLFFMNILCIGSFCAQKAHNRTQLFGSLLLKHGRHFYYWTQPLNMRMRVCYLDCHESGLCCYLSIHIENLLLPLRVVLLAFVTYLWLSLVPRLFHGSASNKNVQRRQVG
jgi:hypothetical protein